MKNIASFPTLVAAYCLGVLPAGAALTQYTVTRLHDFYPLAEGQALGFTNGNGVVTGTYGPDRRYAVTPADGSAPRLVPPIPGAVGQGNTGEVRPYSESGLFVASAYDNTWETNSTSHVPHVYSAGAGWTSIGKPGGQNAIVTSINNSGQVIAAGLNASVDETSSWRYSNGTGWQDLGNLGHASGYARAARINEAGTVVGRSLDADGNQRPFYYTDSGGMQTFTDNSGNQLFGEASAISNNGIISGTANGRAYWFNSQTLEFEFVTPQASQQVVDTNNAGMILGVFAGAPFMGIPGGSAWIGAKGDGYAPLGNLIEGNLASLEWSINSAVDINDDGWILGVGYNYRDRQSYQVLLRPVPEPTGAALAALTGAALLQARKRRTMTVAAAERTN